MPWYILTLSSPHCPNITRLCGYLSNKRNLIKKLYVEMLIMTLPTTVIHF